MEKFNVYVSNEVYYECLQNIQSGKVVISNVRRFKNNLSRCKTDYDFNKCIGYITSYCKENNINNKLDNGEKHSLALSLYLNNIKKEPILLLIDDFEAIPSIQKILSEQKFAIQKSVPDIMLNIYKNNLAINSNTIRGALQSYYYVMKKAVVHRIFRKRMKYNCRYYWECNCGLSCLNIHTIT